jgi:hypothetical protein
MPLALQNFLLVVVMPIVVGTGMIMLFRWGVKRATGYDPLGEKGRIHPNEANTSTRPETYAPYMPPKKREDTAQQE